MKEFVVGEDLLSTVNTHTHNALIVLELSTLTKARNDTMAIKVKENEMRGNPPLRFGESKSARGRRSVDDS